MLDVCIMKSTLPPNKNKHLSIDASALVKKYLELLKLVPEKLQWTEEYLKGSPPKYYRWLQLKCLCKVFNVGSIDSFINGDFIFDRDMEPYYNKIMCHCSGIVAVHLQPFQD